MPLTPAAPRQFAEQRSITYRGYRRDDGLWDIEGVLVDSRAVETVGLLSRYVPVGGAVHEMLVRLTLDDQLTIQAIEAVMDSHPYDTCTGVLPNFQRLVGQSIGQGFAKRLFAAVGHTQGCTHVVTLIQGCATVAVRTLAAHNQSWFADAGSELPSGERPRLLDSCHSFSASGPLVQRMWPTFYIAPAKDAE